MSRQEPPMSPPPPHLEIEIIEPDPEDCQDASLPPEGNVKLRNYRLLADNLRTYTPTGDIHTSPTKRKLVPRFEPCATLAPPRERILELLRPEDPGREALEAIVRPAPRRGLQRPLDDDTRRFLQRALLSPSPLLAPTPEPPRERALTPEPAKSHHEATSCYHRTAVGERSLAEELREAEEGCGGGGGWYTARQLGGGGGAVERERLGRLALAVEGSEGAAAAAATADGALGAAARRLDALLAESRALHAELAGIHEDMQMCSARAGRCAASARALGAESRALRYLDDVVALLKGDVAAAVRARSWPFALGKRLPDRNYVV